MSKRVLTISIALLFGCSVLSAQQQQPPPSDQEKKTAAAQEIGKDEILILVNIKADSLRFDVVPNTTVEFPGTHQRTNIWMTDRQNLPDQVEPGVTYRNIGLQLRISTRFADIEQIIREILGEIPPSSSMTNSTTLPQPVSPPAVTATTTKLTPAKNDSPTAKPQPDR